MRNIIAKILIWIGLFGVMWFIATIDNLNLVPLSGLILALICFPIAFRIGDTKADYIETYGEGDEE